MTINNFIYKKFIPPYYIEDATPDWQKLQYKNMEALMEHIENEFKRFIKENTNV